jgi:hypothetical protein
MSGHLSEFEHFETRREYFGQSLQNKSIDAVCARNIEIEMGPRVSAAQVPQENGMTQHPPTGGDNPLPNTVNGLYFNKLRDVAERLKLLAEELEKLHEPVSQPRQLGILEHYRAGRSCFQDSMDRGHYEVADDQTNQSAAEGSQDATQLVTMRSVEKG